LELLGAGDRWYSVGLFDEIWEIQIKAGRLGKGMNDTRGEHYLLNKHRREVIRSMRNTYSGAPGKTPRQSCLLIEPMHTSGY
jgi:hypothetical protein